MRGLKLHCLALDMALAMSHPTWVRGLKLPYLVRGAKIYVVAPYVGAWIETLSVTLSCLCTKVAPYVGAWIETKRSETD